MRKFLGVLVILALIVGGFGYYRGWFTVQSGGADGSPNVTFGLDKEKLKHDTDLTAATYASTLRSHQGKLSELEERAKAADDATREKIADHLEECGRRHEALTKKLGDLKSATGAKYDELKSEIKTELDDLGSALDRALADTAKK